MASGVTCVCADQAALALGLAIVPVHRTDNPGNVGFILEGQRSFGAPHR